MPRQASRIVPLMEAMKDRLAGMILIIETDMHSARSSVLYETLIPELSEVAAGTPFKKGVRDRS